MIEKDILERIDRIEERLSALESDEQEDLSMDAVAIYDSLTTGFEFLRKLSKTDE